jgi:hypothetical protein
MVSQDYTAYGAVDITSGKMDSLILPHVNETCIQIFIDEVASRYPQERMVMICDGAGWHKAKHLKLPIKID